MTVPKRPGDEVVGYVETIRQVGPFTWGGVADFRQGGAMPAHDKTLRVTAVSGSAEAVSRALRAKARRIVRGRTAR